MGDVRQSANRDRVRCVITGKWVPADETIEIQGYRVCAEGKEELLRRLRSGESMPGEMERPSVLRRFGCILLDHIIVGLGEGFVSGATGGIIALTILSDSDDPVTRALVMRAVSGVLQAGIILCYFGLMHGLKGRTVGKMAGRLKVVNLDGTPVTMQKAFARAFYYGTPYALAALLPLFGLLSIEVPGGDVMALILGMLVFALVGYTIVNAVLALTDGRRQRARRAQQPHRSDDQHAAAAGRDGAGGGGRGGGDVLPVPGVERFDAKFDPLPRRRRRWRRRCQQRGADAADRAGMGDRLWWRWRRWRDGGARR